MTTQETVNRQDGVSPENDAAGARTRLPGRRELVTQQRQQGKRTRPYLVLGLLILAGLMGVVAYYYFQVYVSPPRQPAVRVQDKTYSRGDVVNYIRFNQRITEQLGQQFEIGNSLFDALQTIQDNEIAFRAAPALGVTVTEEQVDRFIEATLGFPALSDEERADPAIRASLAEAKRQFLNTAGLKEEAHRDIVRKELFKGNVRDVLSNNVPRIQPQVHVFEIVLTTQNQQTLQRIERDITAGVAASDVAMRYSQDPDIQRTKGEVGWIPRRAVPEIDGILFGTKEDGSRVLPIGQASEPQYNSDARTYNVYIVTEYSEAREVGDAYFQKLADLALRDFINQERSALASSGSIWMALDDKIYGWVNTQVRLASVLPTPTPGTTGLGF